MATITITQAKYLGNKWGLPGINRGGPERSQIKETAGQVYDAGQPVYYDASGTIALAAATGNVVGKLAGFATKDATGTTGAEARYRAIVPGDLYVMNVKGTSTTTNPLTLQGDKCVFDLDGADASAKLVCNPDGTQDDDKPAGVIEELYTVANGYPDGDTAGDTNGRVVVRFVDNTGLQG